MVATRSTIAAAHSLLHDGPLSFVADEEAVVVDPESVLDCSRVDLCCHPAVVRESSTVDVRSLPVLDELERSASRSFAFTAGDEDPNFVLSLRQTFLERTTHRGGDTARVPVEPEDTAEGLKPMWVGKASQKLSSAVLENHHFSDSRSKLSHAFKKPFWSSAGMKRKCSATSTLRHSSAVKKTLSESGKRLYIRR